MNKYIKFFSVAAVMVAAGALTQSCSVDEPFGTDGEGVLQMRLVLNSDLTRAETDQAELSSNCVVYISNAKGLIHKFQGIENVPAQIQMKSGHYVAEAWTGDSVSASFDKKFFRGYQPFDISTGVQQVVVNCKIANVVASVNASQLDALKLKEFNIKVENSRASLDFTAENYETAKGYFMMADGEAQNLEVTMTGKSETGQAFTKTQTIYNVQRAHEYVLGFTYNPGAPVDGGAFINLIIDDSEILVESEVEIFSRPAFSGFDFDPDKQIVGNAGGFNKDYIIKANAFGDIAKFTVESPDYQAFGLPAEKIDLTSASAEVTAQVKSAGLDWDKSKNEEKNLITSFITMSAALFNRLPERDTQYQLTLTVEDSYGKANSQLIRVAVGEGAVVIDDPVTVEDAVNPQNVMAVLATKATLSGSIVSSDAGNPGIEYRESGSSEWQFVPASASAAAKAARRHLTPAQALRAKGVAFNVEIGGLKPGTRYEYRAVADGFASESKFFTTEGAFIIPNAGMEDWSECSDGAANPNANGEISFWDTGNHGSQTMGKNITTKNTSMYASGSASANLKSQFVGLGAIGKNAAGNIFAGVYAKTDGTDGIIDFGRTYNGSHPSKLKVMVNYRPAKIEKEGSNIPSEVHLHKGDMDEGQIYIALSTAPIHVETKYKDRDGDGVKERMLFNKDAQEVLAYGSYIFKGNYGDDNTLKAVEVPFEYNERALTNKPLYITIVATASLYGDYFTTGEGTVMVVDDFELIY